MQTDGVGAILAAGVGTDGWETGGAGVDVETAGDGLALVWPARRHGHVRITRGVQFATFQLILLPSQNHRLDPVYQVGNRSTFSIHTRLGLVC